MTGNHNRWVPSSVDNRWCRCKHYGGDSHEPQLIPDAAGGAIITWREARSGPAYDIYAQRIDAGGTVQWIANGIAMCTAISDQLYPQIVSDGAGGAIATWVDGRHFSQDVYAQRISGDGRFAYPLISAVQDVPKDQGGKIGLQWKRSYGDVLPDPEVTHYSVWRRLAHAQIALFTGATGEVRSRGALNGPDKPRMRLSPSNGDYAWEWLADVPAHQFDTYALTVQSLYDSMGVDPGWQYFMVSTQTNDQVVYSDSPVDSGYSVDNLSPNPPQALAGDYTGTFEVTLTWDPNTESDLSHYAVYKGSAPDFVPDIGNRLGTPAEPTFVDPAFDPSGETYYKVSAWDVHENESVFAILSHLEITGVGPGVVRYINHLSQNMPNPFNPVTSIAFSIKDAGYVELRVFDVSGRLVRVLVDASLEPRQYEAVWDGTDQRGKPAASGVYFYQLEAPGWSETKKMTLAR